MKKYLLLILVIALGSLLILTGCEVAETQDAMDKDDSMMDNKGDAMVKDGDAMDADAMKDDSMDADKMEDKMDADADSQDDSAANGDYFVDIMEDGFQPETLDIKVGETVTWTNQRTGRLNKAFVQGSRTCVDVKSGTLESGDSFSWTFVEAEKCTIVDVITTNQIMVVTITE